MPAVCLKESFISWTNCIKGKLKKHAKQGTVRILKWTFDLTTRTLYSKKQNKQVNFKFHMHDKIVSHVWKDFTWNKMHGKKVHRYDKNFSHVLQNFTCMSKSSHACEILMWWTCIFANIDFTWFLFFHTLFTPFSHDFHTHSPSPSLSSFELAIACYVLGETCCL